MFGLSTDTHVANAVAAAAISFADHAAISDGECLHDYTSLWEAVECFAIELAEAGVAPGARVAVYSGAGYECLPVLLAVESLGALAVPLDNSEAPRTTRHQLAAAVADHLICHRGDEHLVAEILHDCDAAGPTMTALAEDYTLLRLRRGTRSPSYGAGFAFCGSSSARPVAVGSAAATAAARELRDRLAIAPGDVVALTEPVATRGLLTAFLATLLTGACLSLRRYGGADSARVAEHLRADEASVLLCSDTRLRTLRTSGVSALRHARVAHSTRDRVLIVDQLGESGRPDRWCRPDLTPPLRAVPVRRLRSCP